MLCVSNLAFHVPLFSLTVVPMSWNRDNYAANMQELQTKIDNQKKYIKLQQNKGQRNKE